MKSSKLLIDILKKEGSNFDIFRLIAALAVIVGHAYALVTNPVGQDGVLSILHFDYSGSLAVKFFFFLSGLLVTNSIIAKPNAFHFLIKRACRIFPALIVCLLVAVFVIGPIFTKLPLIDYFTHPETWSYIKRNLLLSDLQWRLPEVFNNNRTQAVNGSLWTLPYECLCYIYLSLLFGLGFLRKRIVASIFFTIAIAISFLAPTYLPVFFSQNPDSHLLPGIFALGALAATNKEFIKINPYHAILLWLGVFVFRNSITYQYFFYIAGFYTTLYFASLPFVINRLKLPFDASYGVYIYGYMIQQSLAAAFPAMGVHTNQFIALVTATTLGILSWHFIEKHFITLGHDITRPDSPLQKRFFDRVKKFSVIFSNKETYMKSNFFALLLLTLLAFVMHAVVLKFVFPGYYSPLYPHHSDFYIPAAFAHAPGEYYSFKSLLFWPRPIYLIVAKFFGYFGIHGGIAWIIALVFFNCSLSALFIKRVFNFAVDWKFIAAYVVYCGLLFSQPYFYTFYSQDLGAHLSYFFLILAAHLFYSTYKKSTLLSNGLLLACSLLAFLSKETYGLTALFFTFLWFLYYRKTSFLKAALPFVMVSIAFVVAFICNVLIKSTFVDLHAQADAPYHINLSPYIVLREMWRYFKEAINIANIITVGLIGYLVLTYKETYKKELLFLTIGCIVAVGLSWLPNAVLPNHHYRGYSFNAMYLLYLPLLFLAMLSVNNNLKKGLVVAALVLGVMSPAFNRSKYHDIGNEWVLLQETTQRNLLNALDPLMRDLAPSKTPHKIVIQGLTIPFHPFSYPECIRSFPHAEYANFDVVYYNTPLLNNGERQDLVKAINPPDVNKKDYEQIWIFDNDGKLVKTINLVADRLNNKDTLQNAAASNVKINFDNLSQFTTTGFYGPENGINWTNGNASVMLNNAISNTDTITVHLNTYMPPQLKNVMPRVLLVDGNNKTVEPVLSTRKEDEFYYQFVVDKKTSIQKIDLKSETFRTPPDERILSFLFKSLYISTNKTN